MNWIASSEKETAAAALEKRPWDAADTFLANPPFNVNSAPQHAHAN